VHYKTVCFREFVLFYPCDEPYRKSAQKLNRALRRKEGQEVRARTMANLVEREGEQIQAHIEKKQRVFSSWFQSHWIDQKPENSV